MLWILSLEKEGLKDLQNWKSWALCTKSFLIFMDNIKQVLLMLCYSNPPLLCIKRVMHFWCIDESLNKIFLMIPSFFSFTFIHRVNSYFEGMITQQYLSFKNGYHLWLENCTSKMYSLEILTTFCLGDVH